MFCSYDVSNLIWDVFIIAFILHAFCRILIAFLIILIYKFTFMNTFQVFVLYNQTFYPF